MHKTIISDTSCFIILSNIKELDLLQKVYGRIVTTPDVAAEFGEDLPEWVKIESVQDKFKQQLLELELDRGEASAIALAIETPQSTVIIDDHRARKVAEKLGLNFTGTIGVIIRARLEGIIVSVKPFLAKIRQTNFRITEEVEKQALIDAGEDE